MSVSVQPSFAPNEFVYRWLFRTKSPPLRHEHEKSHEDVDTIPPVRHKHTHRSKGEAEQMKIPCSPNRKGARAHRSEHHHEHHQKSTQRAPVPHTPFHAHTDGSGFEEKDLKDHHRRKRPRSDRGASETGGQCSRRSPFRRPLSGVRSKGSPQSEHSSRKRGADFPTACGPAVRNNSEKRYERRPRHKTKPDKYEPGLDKSVADKDVHELAHKKSKRKRRKKSGLALNHDFKAPNVLQERLTLRPNDGPGIFHRGKASVPVERRGLPDLTFSEMDFLTKRRDIGNARHRKPEEVQSSTKKPVRGSAQEVSTFFSKPEEHNKVVQDLVAHVPGQWGNLMKQSISPNKSSPQMLGVRKPLSMVSGNEAHTRAFSTTGLGPAPPSKCWAPEPHPPTIQHHFSAQKRSPVPHKRDSSTTSYYSWSATPSEMNVRRADLLGSPKALRSVVKKPSYVPLLPRSRKSNVVEVGTRPPDQSPVSNRSLEQYTKHVLLQEDVQKNLVCDPGAAGRGGYYTLQDLQILSRLSELGRANGDSAIHIDQPCGSESRGRVDIPLADLDEHEHALLADIGSREGHRPSAVTSMAPFSKSPIHQPRREGFVSESTADSAATGAQVAQSGRQGARPADHLPLRDSLRLENLIFSPDQPVWLRNPTSPYAGSVRPKPVSRNAKLARNSPFARLPQTHGYGHQLCDYEDSAEPTSRVSYPEPSLTTQVRSRGPTGPAEPVTRPKPLHVSQGDIHSIEYRMMHEFDDNACESTFGEGQDDFDRALIQEPCSKSIRDPSVNVLDPFALAGTRYSFADPGSVLSHNEEELVFGDIEMRAMTPGNNASTCNTRVALSEGNVVESKVSGNGSVSNRAPELNLVLGNSYQENEERFMGFSRPHVLY